MSEPLSPKLWEKWAAARVWAVARAPYLSGALLALDPIVAPDEIRHFPVDTAWHVYVGAKELERRSVPEVGFWLIHQTGHLLREHARRYPGTNERLERRHWNLAADAEINDDLTDLPLPPDAITPARLELPEGWTAEQYHQALSVRVQEGDRLRDEQPAERNRSLGRAERPPTADGGSSRDPQPMDRTNVRDEQPADCGSGCDGQPRPWETDRPGLSATGARLTALDTARRIRERLDARDDVPAGWLRWADQVLEPTINWRRHLATTIRHGLAQAAGRVDYTYRTPSRRAAALPGIVLPSLHRPAPSVTVLIDTSGSITEGLLGQALAEVTGVLRAVGVGRRKVTVISCDAQAYRPQTLARITDLQLGGGGGTDLRAGFEAAQASGPPPDLIIALTDGRTPWPDRPPTRSRVVVGLLDKGGQAPAWARTVQIGEE
ncbi:VWA-like domain-containing protein [Nonomuraea fuscirosea]|uniref:vWA domain-containing protein n=1 Tax=Nonomuraea fuscirosea TaxID=1291556 RepID=UPI0037147B86